MTYIGENLELYLKKCRLSQDCSCKEDFQIKRELTLGCSVLLFSNINVHFISSVSNFDEI